MLGPGLSGENGFRSVRDLGETRSLELQKDALTCFEPMEGVRAAQGAGFETLFSVIFNLLYRYFSLSG